MTDLPKVIREKGRIATLRISRKQHRCSECPRPIDKGQQYYEVVIGGGGLGSLKYPGRVHLQCCDSYLRDVCNRGR